MRSEIKLEVFEHVDDSLILCVSMPMPSRDYGGGWESANWLSREVKQYPKGTKMADIHTEVVGALKKLLLEPV